MKKAFKVLAICLIVVAIDLIIFGAANYSRAKQIEKMNRLYTDDIDRVSNNCENSVVQIFAQKRDNEYLGTGFFINDTQIITSYHVVDNSKNIFISFKDDYFAYKASILKYDAKNDIAILEVNEAIPEHETLDITTSYDTGDFVYACGFDLDYNVKPSIIEEKMYMYEENDYIKINIPVNNGNSGGPVLDKNGNVIGIVSIGNFVSSSLTPAEKLLNILSK